MAVLIWAVLLAFGLLFALKIVFVVSAAGVLPITQGALYVSTARVRIRTALDRLPMDPGTMFYDLGCGDGRVLRAAHKQYGVRAIGFDVNLLAWAQASVRCMFLKRVSVKWGNFRKADLSEANVVSCYLFPDALRTLKPKLEKELTPGTRVVSFNFPIPGWIPEKIIRPEPENHSDPIYFYEI